MAAIAAPVSSIRSQIRLRSALVASADGSFRQRLNSVLTGLRWQVREADGGAQAWGEAMDAQPQVIIVDSWLPDLDRNEFLREFHAAFPGVDVITAGQDTALESAPGPHRKEILYALRRTQESDTAAWNAAPNLDNESTTPLQQPVPPECSVPAIEGGPLAGGAMALWGRARLGWAGMAPRQRHWTAATAAMLVGLIGGLLWYGLSVDWRTLYSGLDPEDARQIGLTLTQAQIPYDVADNGMTLRVPAAQLDKARLATAAKGVKSGRMGFELFDKPNWVGSEFDEQVNYQRALEGELEHTVGSLADVESARVHLVLAHDSLFRDQERPAKASVVMKLRHASLADGEADSIRNLVASAVDGLSPDHVVLVDAAGHVPLGPKTPDAMRLGAEQALEDKLLSTLEPVTGPGNVRASVTIDYDPDAIEETKETYDPAQSATLSMERTEQSTGGQAVAAGVPGTASNAPNTQSLPVYPRQATPPQTSKTESGTYGVSKAVRHMIENPGKVRRLTAAVVVNDRLVQAATPKSAAQWQPRSADELRNLTALTQAAVGFDSTRGDVITVEDIPFDENRAQPSSFTPVQMMTRAVSSPLLVKYLTLLIAILAVLVLGVRPALQRAGQGFGGTTQQRPGGVQGSAALPPPEPALPDPNRVKAQEIFEQVTGQLKNEPAQSSRLLQSWIHSDG